MMRRERLSWPTAWTAPPPCGHPDPDPDPVSGPSPGDRAARPFCGPCGAPARTPAAPAGFPSPRSAPSSWAFPNPCCPSTAAAPAPQPAVPAAAPAPATPPARTRGIQPCQGRSPGTPGSSDTSRKHVQPDLNLQAARRTGVAPTPREWARTAPFIAYLLPSLRAGPAAPPPT